MPSELTGTPIIVRHDGSARFIAQVRSHKVVVDQPRNAGGEDAGPMPIELLGTALGTCIAYYVCKFLEAREISCDGLQVEVEQYSARNPSRVGEFAVSVVLPAPISDAYVEMLERVTRSCPAHNTLVLSTPVRVRIERPVLA